MNNHDAFFGHSYLTDSKDPRFNLDHLFYVTRSLPNAMCVSVYLAIYYFLCSGTRNPSLQDIADKAKVSRRSAIRHMDTLVQLGVVHKVIVRSQIQGVARATFCPSEYYLPDVDVSIPTPTEPKEVNGYIYFIDNGSEIKIGFSHDPTKRLMQLKKQRNDNNLKIVHAIEGTLEDEGRLHKKFADSCVNGEWFARDVVLNHLSESMRMY